MTILRQKPGPRVSLTYMILDILPKQSSSRGTFGDISAKKFRVVLKAMSLFPYMIPHGNPGLTMELNDLIFYRTGAMSFHDKSIPHEVLIEILKAATSCAWLGRWRMISVTDRNRRANLVEVWKEGLSKMGREKDAEFVKRWRLAPLFIAFCQPAKSEPFGWVPSEYARIYSIQEVGTAVRSLELKALDYGIGLHGIMGLLLPELAGRVKIELGIPETQELVFFGIMGYPNEIVEQTFPELSKVCYFETWQQG